MSVDTQFCFIRFYTPFRFSNKSILTLTFRLGRLIFDPILGNAGRNARTIRRSTRRKTFSNENNVFFYYYYY